MRARFINEIVKGKKSGINSIGIGREKMDIGYKKMIEIHGDYIQKFIRPISEFNMVSVYPPDIGNYDPAKKIDIKFSKYEKQQVIDFTGYEEKDLYFVDNYLNSKYDTEELSDFLKRYEIKFLDIKKRMNSKLDNWEFEWCAAVDMGYLQMDEGETIYVIFKK